MALINTDTDRVHTDEEIARMRAALQEWSGLDLSDMSDKSIVANYLMHERRGERL